MKPWPQCWRLDVMLKIEFTAQMKRDVKKMQKRGKDMESADAGEVP